MTMTRAAGLPRYTTTRPPSASKGSPRSAWSDTVSSSMLSNRGSATAPAASSPAQLPEPARLSSHRGWGARRGRGE